MIPPNIAAKIVEQYLDAEVQEDLAALRALFAENVVIRNAANPPDDQPGALERFAMSFWDRTETRSFTLEDVAVSGKKVFALVEATMRFKKGAPFGPVAAVAAFTITLPVAILFQLDANQKVTKLDIFHETTTAVRLAAGAAAE